MYAVAASIHVLWSLVLSWVLLAVQVKRCHDMGRSGWMVLVGLIPLLGSIVLLAILGFVKGDSGYNVYGADPLRTWMRK